MPGGSGTGPGGMGPMTGRGAGYCTGFAAPGRRAPGRIEPFGRGRGFKTFLGLCGLIPVCMYVVYRLAVRERNTSV